MAGLVDFQASNRLASAELTLPGLEAAVRARVAAARSGDRYQGRLESQIRSLADRLARDRVPDAFLVPAETVEEAIQLSAAGGRAALLETGRPTADPVGFEDGLAGQLLNDPTIPLAVEGVRRPRPPVILPPPGGGDAIWREILDASVDPDRSGSVVGARHANDTLSATIASDGAGLTLAVAEAGVEDWRVVASAETRLIVNELDRSRLTAHRYQGLEVRPAGSNDALDRPPFASGDIRDWGARPGVSVRPPTGVILPLFGADYRIPSAVDSRASLGIPIPLLVPSPGLLALLGLQPFGAFRFLDREEVGLSLVIWRAGYEPSDYHLPRAHLTGVAIIMAPGPFALVADRFGDDLVTREFLMGSSGLAATDT